MTGQQLASYIARFGRFEYLDLMQEPVTMKSKEWAAIAFPDFYTALSVCRAVDGATVGGKRLQCFIKDSPAHTALIPPTISTAFSGFEAYANRAIGHAPLTSAAMSASTPAPTSLLGGLIPKGETGRGRGDVGKVDKLANHSKAPTSALLAATATAAAACNKCFLDAAKSDSSTCTSAETTSLSHYQSQSQENVKEGVKTFISNIDWRVNAKELYELLLPFGDIIQVQLKLHPDTGKSKGWATVYFKDKEGADAAIKTWHERTWKGRKLTVRLDRIEYPDEGSDCNVYAGNLNYTVTTEMLAQEFSAFKPKDIVIPRTSFGNHRGYAILKFGTPQDAAAAIEAKHHTVLCERSMECRLDKGTSKPTEKSIIVSNLGPTTTSDDLYALFQHIGPIVSAEVQRRSNGTSKLWAKIAYSQTEHNRQAVERMDGCPDPTTGNRLTVALNRKG